VNRRKERMYVYHQAHAPKVVLRLHLERWQANGWRDSPPVKTTDFGIQPEDESGVQVLGETVQGVRDYCNCTLNVSIMSKADLVDCAQTHFNKDFEFGMKVKPMRRQLRGFFSLKA